MQKNCASCAHVGVCSKRMRFIVNNYLAKGRYEEIENVSKTLDISVNCNDYNEKDLFSFLCERVRDYSDGEVWSDGDQILCKTESAANALCDLLWQLTTRRVRLPLTYIPDTTTPRRTRETTRRTDTPAGGMCPPISEFRYENPQYLLGYRRRRGGSCLPAEGGRTAEQIRPAPLHKTDL